MPVVAVDILGPYVRGFSLNSFTTCSPRPLLLVSLFTSCLSVFGYVGPFTEWLVMDLDFSSVVPNQCVYPDNYYIWEPADEVSTPSQAVHVFTSGN